MTTLSLAIHIMALTWALLAACSLLFFVGAKRASG
jgi:hypothetical protein